MKKTVLVPLDGSDYSCHILAMLIDLFDPQHYHLRLLRVTDPPIVSGDLYPNTVDGWGALIDWANLVPPKLKKNLDLQQAAQTALLEKELTADLLMRPQNKLAPETKAAFKVVASPGMV